MTRTTSRAALLAVVLVTAAPFGIARFAQAQPARGAAGEFERVRSVMSDRFKTTKLTGDPDQDFAALLIASFEETLFLAKAQLNYGGDRELREVAQKIQDEQQERIDALKKWQVRSREPGYREQPNRTPSGEGPLDRPAQAGPAQAQAAPSSAQPPAASAPGSTANTPLVKGTVQKIDDAAGKVTLDHERIPNIDMDAMTMAYKVQDPTMLKDLKVGQKVRFSADRVDGAIAVTRIQKVK
jgi:Cu/Ag efflux protein CusF